MYKIVIRPILFLFKPEAIHDLVFIALNIGKRIPGMGALLRKLFTINDKRLSKTLWDIEFPNPIGLAAGLDKNAEAFEMFGDMGFGFVEIGTFTPLAQSGNDKPRLFRLKKDKGLINRMGFNNHGVDYIVNKLADSKRKVIIGGNIGKNKLTPNDKAVDDYLFCLNSLHSYVDYFVVNVSSPNTPNLRELQDKGPLKEILNTLQLKNLEFPKPKPILLKIAPDLTNSQLDDIIEIVNETKIAGLVATNTTIERSNLSYSEEHIQSIGAGGLSGLPLKERSTEVISYISKKTNGSIPIIGVGGIMDEQDAIDKIEAGASLIQIYTSFIYEGPSLIKRINKALLAKL